MRMIGWIVIAILLLLLAIAGTWAGYAWNELADVEMTHHGWIAMALGILFSLGIHPPNEDAKLRRWV